MTRKLLILPLLLLMAACAAPSPEVAARKTALDALPPMKTFVTPVTTPPGRSNTDIARDFLDLSFRMESGRVLPFMTRFEGPVTVRVAGNASTSLNRDLNTLINRLRTEAAIDIRRARSGEQANITVQALPRAELQRLVPQAACFVAPNVSSWSEYRRTRRSSAVDWTLLRSRERIAVFLPSDVSPQETRDCLHEEIAQALGPLNDLYRLSDSVFNDDNFHAVLTGFDMLILRAYYAPEMRNGTTRAQAAAILPALLNRLNPAGARIASRPVKATPRAWINAMETALGPGVSQANRIRAALAAIEIAQNEGLNDTRLAFSQFALGRLALGGDVKTALNAFVSAEATYANLRGAGIHRAHVTMHLAAFTLSSGQSQAALDMINANLRTVAAAENASLLATMLMIKAEALDALGRGAEAKSVRLDSLGWARYGFGSDQEVRTRLLDIVALSPERPAG
ncbi:hypothetical protein ACMU_13150 [Actibacterium mucosum KCTC 23349]|uniref:ATP-dependent transcriptional regulator n=1 Tax=Actibacterium mucosum KCTC 23349 TaxID=1454373 RepID=A0A037ZJ19_9RHOB|nr:DUF2927 domain-containing protein [Actibacterium mucosum]KAJ55634.1 hypothetical protein ACMU_13150 [Actibacterium mucosum KCTC 23349]